MVDRDTKMVEHQRKEAALVVDEVSTSRVVEAVKKRCCSEQEPRDREGCSEGSANLTATARMVPRRHSTR